MGGQGVHTGNTDSVQTAGHLVGTFVELSSGMEYGHYDFQGGLLFFLVKVHGDSSTVVLYCDGVVFVDCYFYMCAISGECFIDGVVHDFINQVVQAFFADIADVHGGTLTYGFQAFEYLDVAGRVVAAAVRCQFFTHFSINSSSCYKVLKVTKKLRDFNDLNYFYVMPV